MGYWGSKVAGAAGVMHLGEVESGELVEGVGLVRLSALFVSKRVTFEKVKDSNEVQLKGQLPHNV